MAPALTTIRVVARIVAVLAGTAAVVYCVTAIVGPQVLWVVDSSVIQASGFVTLPLPWRIAHAAAVLLGAVTVAVMSLLVADLSGRIRAGVEFAPVVSRTARSLAVVLAVGSWLTQVAANLAGHAAVIYPDAADPATVSIHDLPIDWALGPSTFLPDPALLGLAVVLGLLAYIVTSGERLQHDVEGLV
jgi:hypothetical protein